MIKKKMNAKMYVNTIEKMFKVVRLEKIKFQIFENKF